MGAAPSRETHIRMLVESCPAPTTTSSTSTTTNVNLSTPCMHSGYTVPLPPPPPLSISGGGGGSKKNDIVLLPLTKQFFPTPDCPLFIQFHDARCDAAVNYYLRRPGNPGPLDVIPLSPMQHEEYYVASATAGGAEEAAGGGSGGGAAAFSQLSRAALYKGVVERIEEGLFDTDEEMRQAYQYSQAHPGEAVGPDGRPRRRVLPVLCAVAFRTDPNRPHVHRRSKSSPTATTKTREESVDVGDCSSSTTQGQTTTSAAGVGRADPFTQVQTEHGVLLNGHLLHVVGCFGFVSISEEVEAARETTATTVMTQDEMTQQHACEKEVMEKGWNPPRPSLATTPPAAAAPLAAMVYLTKSAGEQNLGRVSNFAASTYYFQMVAAGVVQRCLPPPSPNSSAGGSPNPNFLLFSPSPSSSSNTGASGGGNLRYRCPHTLDAPLTAAACPASLLPQPLGGTGREAMAPSFNTNNNNNALPPMDAFSFSTLLTNIPILSFLYEMKWRWGYLGITRPQEVEGQQQHYRHLRANSCPAMGGGSLGTVNSAGGSTMGSGNFSTQHARNFSGNIYHSASASGSSVLDLPVAGGGCSWQRPTTTPSSPTATAPSGGYRGGGKTVMGFPPSPTAQHHSTGGLAEVCQYCGQQITDEMEMWITSDHMLHGRISKNLAEQLCWSLAERSHVLQERLTQLPSEEEHYWRYRGLVDKAHPPPLPYPYPPPSPGTGNNEANPRGEEVSIHPRDVYVMGSDVLPGFDEGDILRYHPQHQVWFADPSIPLEGVVLAAMRPFSKRARESPPDDPHWVTKLVSVTRPEHEALVAEPYPLPPPTPEQAEAMRRDPSLRLVAERSGHFYVYRFERDGTTYFLGTVPNFANPNKKHRMMTATTGARAEEETTLGSAASGDLSSNEKKTPSNNNGEKREKPVHATTTTTTTTPQEEGGGGSGRPSSLSDSFWRSQKAVGVPPSVASALFTLLQDNLGPISSVFGSGVNNGTREGEGERVSSSSCRCPTATEEEGQLDRVNSNPIHGTHPNPHHADSPQPPPRPSSLARYLVDRVKSSKKQCASGFTRRVSDKDFAHQTTTGGYFYSATRWLLERLPSRGKGPGGSGRGGGATTTPTLLQAVNPSSGSAWEESIPSSYPVCAGSNSPDLYTPPAGSPYSINNNNAGVNNSNNTGDSLFFSRPFPPPPLNTVLGGTGSPHAYYGEAPLNVATSPMGGGGGMGSLPSPFYTSSTPWAQNNNINHTNNNSNYTWGGSGGGGGGVSCYGHSSQPSPLLQCHATPAGCTCATSSSHHNGLSCTTASPAGMSYQTLDTLPEDGVATYPPLAAAPMPPLPPPPPPPHTHHYRDASRSFSMHLRSPSTPSSYHSAVGQGPPPRSGLPLHPSGSGFDISVGGGGEMGGSVASTPKQRPPVRKHSNGSFSWDWRTNAELPFTRTE